VWGQCEAAWGDLHAPVARFPHSRNVFHLAPCSYNYQDILLAYPTYNRTCAYSAYAYAVYRGTDNYVDMQDNTYFESVASSNKCVALPPCPSWALDWLCW
jgi:hypothetical protein